MKRCWLLYTILILTSIFCIQSANAGVVNKKDAQELRGKNDTSRVLTWDKAESLKVYLGTTGWVIDGGDTAAAIMCKYLQLSDGPGNYTVWFRNNSGTAQWSDDSGANWDDFGTGTGGAADDSLISWKELYNKIFENNPDFDTTIVGSDTDLVITHSDRADTLGTTVYTITSGGMTSILSSSDSIGFGPEGLTVSDSLLARKLYLLAGVDTFYIGRSTVADGERCLHYVTTAVGPDSGYWGACTGGAGGGTGDTLIINTSASGTGTEYSIVTDRIKVRPSTGITFTRDDSTTYDMIRIAASLGTTISLAEMDANSVDSTKVVDGSVSEADLSIDGAPTDEYALTWEASSGTGGQMKWEAQAGGSGLSYTTETDSGTWSVFAPVSPNTGIKLSGTTIIGDAGLTEADSIHIYGRMYFDPLHPIDSATWDSMVHLTDRYAPGSGTTDGQNADSIQNTPVSANRPADGAIFVAAISGDTTLVPVVLSGDATMANTGAVTVADESHAHTTTTISGLDAGNDISAGTLSTDRYSAYGDLGAESKIGTGSTQVAAGDHAHAAAYAPITPDSTEIDSGNVREWVEDKIGQMFARGTQTNVTVTYGDSTTSPGSLNLNVTGGGGTVDSVGVRDSAGNNRGTWTDPILFRYGFGIKFLGGDSATVDTVRIRADTGTTGQDGLATKDFVRDSAGAGGGESLWDSVGASQASIVHMNGADTTIEIRDSGVYTIVRPGVNTTFMFGDSGQTHITDLKLGINDGADKSWTIPNVKGTASQLRRMDDGGTAVEEWFTPAWLTAVPDSFVGAGETAADVDTNGTKIDMALGTRLDKSDTVNQLRTNRPDTTTQNIVLNGGNIVMQGAETVDGKDVSAIVSNATHTGAVTGATVTTISVDSVVPKSLIGTGHFRFHGVFLGDTTVADSATMTKNYNDKTYFHAADFDNATIDTTAAGKLEVKSGVYATAAQANPFSTAIESAEITDQTIVKADIDTTASNIPFDGAYHITTATADSAYVTANTINDSLNLALRLAGGTMTGNIAFSAAQTVDGKDVSTLQDGDATLTDIADGTIAENLVNTDNPWADNEVADNITVSGYLTNIGDTTGDNYRYKFDYCELDTLSLTASTQMLRGFGATMSATAGVWNTVIGASISSDEITDLTIDSTDIINGHIAGNKLLTTGHFAFHGAFHADTTKADSEFATKKYVTDNSGGLSAGIVKPSHINQDSTFIFKGARKGANSADSAFITHKWAVDSLLSGAFLTNGVVKGDMTVYGQFAQNNVRRKTDIGSAYVKPTYKTYDDSATWGDIKIVPNIYYSKTILDLPTRYDTTICGTGSVYFDSSFMVHPSVLYCPNGWPPDHATTLPWEYILAITPMPPISPYGCAENPHVFVSHRMDSGWTTQVGATAADTITNPLYGFDMISMDTLFWYDTTIAGKHTILAYDTGNVGDALAITTNIASQGICDPSLFFDATGDLWLTFMVGFCDTLSYGNGPGADTNWVSRGRVTYAAHTNDLIDWLDTIRITNYALDVSPSAVMIAGGKYVMMVRRMIYDTLTGSDSGLYRFTADDPRTGWTNQGKATWPPLNGDTNDDSTKYALREYFGAGAYVSSIHLPWHYQLLRTGADEILMIGVYHASDDGAIFLAASYDDGVTWNLPYRPMMPSPRPGNLSGTYDNASVRDSTLYTPTAVYVNAGSHDKLEILYSAWRGNTHYRTFYTEATFSAFPTTYNYDAIYGLAGANANWNLTFESFKNDSFWIFVDSLKSADAKTDSFGIRIDFDRPFDSDSLIFDYMTTDAHLYIDSLALYVPKNGKFHKTIADSLAWGTGENFNATSWTRLAIKWRDVFSAGEEIRLKVFVTGDASHNGKIIRARDIAFKGRTFEE